MRLAMMVFSVFNSAEAYFLHTLSVIFLLKLYADRLQYHTFIEELQLRGEKFIMSANNFLDAQCPQDEHSS